MEGFGNELASITLDGQPLSNAAIPASLSGRHTLRMVLKNQAPVTQAVSRVPNLFSPEVPVITYANNKLQWPKNATQEEVLFYQVLKNGAVLTLVPNNSEKEHNEFGVSGEAHAVYQVVACAPDRSGVAAESFASEPLEVNVTTARQLQLETVAPKAALPYQGYTGTGFVEISKTRNTKLTIPLQVPEDGLYALDFRYANGNGPINTENKCAIRTLRDATGQQLGTVVLPQRGTGEWSNWGYSNAVLVRLRKGKQQLTLAFEPANENMNGAVNQAMLDHLRLRRVE
jgi:hypothetical protein